MRNGRVERRTKETEITVELSLDGSGIHDISTGIGFFDHMLEQLARHSLIDIALKAKGDLHIDMHHTVEDSGIALGQALSAALGDRVGIFRYGECHLPMDEALTRCALDLSGRGYLVWKVAFSRPLIGEMETELFREFFQALAINSGMTLTSRLFMVPTTTILRKPQGAGTGAPHGRRDRSATALRHPLHQGHSDRIGHGSALLFGSCRAMESGNHAAGRRSHRHGEGRILWPAFLISLPWLIWHRMWIVLVLYLALAIGLAALSEFGQVPDQAMAIASLVIALVLGLEGNSLRRWTLARRGYEEIGEVAAETPQAAEMRFFERRGHRTADGAAP